MNNPLDNIRNMMTIEDQLRGEVLKIVRKFLVDNANQKITVWNGPALIATLQTKMKNIVTDYDNRRKEKENNKKKENDKKVS